MFLNRNASNPDFQAADLCQKQANLTDLRNIGSIIKTRFLVEYDMLNKGIDILIYR